MRTYLNPIQTDWKTLSERPTLTLENLMPLVQKVFKSVEINGDVAIRKYTTEFDKVDLIDFRVTEGEITSACQNVSEQLKEAIKIAAYNIKRFHQSQITLKEVIETTKDVFCWQETRAIENVGIYIPGGTAPLFSTVLMLGIPATIAGCDNIVLCTPPNQAGEIHPAILYAAQLIGIKEIHKVGGIQAIAALSYGTATIPKVYKIFGPGNQYVTAAKQFAQQVGIAIDMPAGPSELLVMADETSNLDFVAADLLSQAEHGEDSQVIAVLSNKNLLSELSNTLETQLSVLPRKDIAAIALQNSRVIILSDLSERIEFVNQYAPEHLIITEQNPEEILDKIKNAGSVFIGAFTPESAGDYASGTNHTLPTNGYATAYSGINLDAFVKKITVQKITEKGIRNLGKTIEIMAEAEQLQAHKNAVSIRLKYLES
ncbi:MAG: histidinol dehydrogenase [Crocinitomix sp.]|jgi:histidinol dehydrogenase